MIVPYFNAQEYEFKIRRDLEKFIDQFVIQGKAHKLPPEIHKQDLKAPH